MRIYNELQQQYLKFGNVQSLMKYINTETLKEKHHEMKLRKATGVDSISKADYDINIDENLHILVSKLKAGTYEPSAIRRCFIPKSNGKLRPLGIPAYEDRLVQSVMSDILHSIYEPIFLDCSHGYRINRNCHTALHNISKLVEQGNIHYIVESDIKGFFDNINHEKLIELLKLVIQDKHFINYIWKFLITDVYYAGTNTPSIAGTPQGGAISPILGNIYLHYVLDDWFEKCIKPICKDCLLIRYCDDFIACFTNKKDANIFYNAVQERLQEFSLCIEPNKTKILKFNIHDQTSETFCFLGFNISVNTHKQVNFMASYNKLTQKISDINNKIVEMVSLGKSPIECIHETNSLLLGIYNYYGIQTNRFWLQELHNMVFTSLINILCFNKDTECISLVELNELLEQHPLATPTEHLICI